MKYIPSYAYETAESSQSPIGDYLQPARLPEHDNSAPVDLSRKIFVPNLGRDLGKTWNIPEYQTTN